ncbi:putative zinc metalloprotease [Mycena floridula]|nr:putative zinc metalloprotease [Mycena floridula]
MLDAIAKVIGFRTGPTTFAIIVIYLAIFISVFLTDELPVAPESIELRDAYADLHQIAARPHPYNSHANQLVEEYILQRLKTITNGHEHVTVEHDLLSNGTWASSEGVYFESNNLLIKIEGTDKDDPRCLSTASGATDDGMGTVTLIQLVKYFTHNPPKKTVIFNINNGEEDWLNGAHAFMEHPWSNLTKTFLNLEGAAAGGRPLLFRASSLSAVRAFKTIHPHGNVLSADAFARGVVRSGTDYSVYTDFGMNGLDVAFYKGRSKYHTKYDSIPYTEGEENSLWAMMESAKAVSISLANSAAEEDTRNPVYFDLFGSFFVVLPLDSLMLANVLFLSLSPLVLILFLVCEAIIQRTRYQSQNGGYHPNSPNLLTRLWSWGTKSLWQFSKFWVALVITIGMQVLLGFGYMRLNPFIVYSSPYVVAYLSLVLTIGFPGSLFRRQKQTVLLQTFFLSWVLLLASTIIIARTSVGGLYFVSAWAFVVFVACILGCLEGILGGDDSSSVADERVVRFEATEATLDENPPLEFSPELEEEPTESTPLIQRSAQHRVLVGKEGGALLWWLLQALLVIPVPVILISHIGVLLIAALSQTLADGSSAVTVYGAISLVAVFLIIPIAPFSFRLHRSLTFVMLAVFAIATAYTYLSFPFSQDAPLKVFFQQQLTIDHSGITRETTTLTGLKNFLQPMLVPKLPSALNSTVECDSSSNKMGLQRCSWPSGLLPAPGGTDPTSQFDWLKVSTSRRASDIIRISVQGRNTRSCRLYFDKPIAEYSVQGGRTELQPGYPIGKDGIKELRLWSRTWDRNFIVDIRTDPSLTFSGRAACEWVEYESGSIGVNTGGKIPAFEEVLTFLPSWAAVSKLTDGLVEVIQEFSV